MFQREERTELMRRKKNLLSQDQSIFFFFNFLSLTKTFTGEIEMGAGLTSELRGYMKVCWHEEI